MNKYIEISIIASVPVLLLLALKSVLADDLDTMGTFCAMALPNETIKTELVANNFIDNKFSNVTN